MVIGIGEPEKNEPDLRASIAENEVLTDTIRQQELFKSGHKFEAVASQAILIEALCLYYIGIRYQAQQFPFADKAGKVMKPLDLSRATFGKLKNLLVHNKALHDPTLEKDLDTYVEWRNTLAHNMIQFDHPLNLNEVFSLGNPIISRMTPLFKDVISKQPGKRK